MLNLGPYLIALLGCGALSALSWGLWRTIAIMRCYTVIVAVWLAGLVYWSLTGDYTHAPLNIITDALAASIIMMRPAGRFQSVLGATYIVQLVIHAAYIVNILRWGSADEAVYYENLTIWAFIQLGVIGVWNGRIWWGRFRRNRDKVGVSSSAQSVAGLGKAG